MSETLPPEYVGPKITDVSERPPMPDPWDSAEGQTHASKEPAIIGGHGPVLDRGDITYIRIADFRAMETALRVLKAEVDARRNDPELKGYESTASLRAAAATDADPIVRAMEGRA